MYNPNMNLERTPLLAEARGQTRDSTHKAVDRLRSRLKKHKKKHKLPRSKAAHTRERDVPPFMPSIGMTVAGPGSFGPVSVGGIMRHS